MPLGLGFRCRFFFLAAFAVARAIFTTSSSSTAVEGVLPGAGAGVLTAATAEVAAFAALLPPHDACGEKSESLSPPLKSGLTLWLLEARLCHQAHKRPEKILQNAKSLIISPGAEAKGAENQMQTLALG